MKVLEKAAGENYAAFSNSFLITENPVILYQKGSKTVGEVKHESCNCNGFF